MIYNSASARTSEIFNTFVRDELPEILKRNIASGKKKSILEFSLRKADNDLTGKKAVFEYVSETNVYVYEVLRDEFIKYMHSLCLSGLRSYPLDEKGNMFITIDTVKLPPYLKQSFPELSEFFSPEYDFDSNLLKAQENTTAVFNSFVRDELPEVIKRRIKDGKAKEWLTFNLKNVEKDYPAKMALFSYVSESATYNAEVIKDEFMKYMRNLCPRERALLPSKEDGHAAIGIDTAQMVDYLSSTFPDNVNFPEIEWDSDFTFSVFNSFVFDELPWIIKRNEDQPNTFVSFTLKETGANFPAKMAVFEYQSDTNTYSACVKKEEFMSYMLRLPIFRYMVPTEKNDGKCTICINTDKLYNYYIEELQKEEYASMTR